MPDKPTHSASFQGSVYRFDIQAQKAQSTRFKITCHGHMYVGQLRCIIASKLLMEPEVARLFANGTPSYWQSNILIDLLPLPLPPSLPSILSFGVFV